MEIPEGALPVKSLEYTMTRNIRVKSYESKTLEYFFYFPTIGEYNVSSVNVVKNGKVIAVSPPYKVTVVEKPTVVQMDNLKSILQHSEDVTKNALTYLANPDLNLLDSKKFAYRDIYWLLKDKDFFEGMMKILRDRSLFDKTVW
jgi:hypothetical protein